MTVKKVILIGSGVRETYIAKRLFIDTNGEIAITVILTKRNPEISSYAKNIFLVNDFSLETFLCNSHIESFINKNFRDIDFAVIGPEQPLKEGFADFFESIGIRTIGPKMNLAKLETSKLFCRKFLRTLEDVTRIKLNPNFYEFKNEYDIIQFTNNYKNHLLSNKINWQEVKVFKLWEIIFILLLKDKKFV